MSQVAATTFTFDLQRFDGNFKVGDNTYSTLQDAYDAASDGDTIELTAAAESTSVLKIQKNITVDLAGHKLTSNVSDNYLFNIFNGFKLTIKDSTEEHKGSIENKGGTYAIEMQPGANLDVENVTLTDSTTSLYGTYWFDIDKDSNAIKNAHDDSVAQNYGEINLINVNAETRGSRILVSPNDIGYISKYKISVEGGSYKSTGTSSEKTGVFLLSGMDATFNGVTIESSFAMPVYAINRYDEDYTESAKTKANVMLKDCTLTQNGTGTATTHQWCECLAAVAAGNVMKIEGGTYTFAGKSYGLYVFSSNGGFIIDGGTFTDNSDSHTMFEFTWDPNGKTSASEKTYGELYSFLGVPFANISGGEFQLGEKALKSGTAESELIISGGEFKNVGEEGSASFTEFLGDNDYYVENDGVYYVTHADPGGWINTTDGATWLNVTKPDSGKVGTLNASLTGSGSTLTLGVARGCW